MTYFQAFKSSIVRIFSGKSVIGAGFLISDRHLLTCAHVLPTALELPERSVEFDFPLLAPGQRVQATVVFWQPENPGQLGEDIAVLEVSPMTLPSGAQSVRLILADEPWGHTFRTFGFPKKLDDGVWVEGVLKQRQAAQWVQMEDIKAQGYAIEPGFSGAPVWDETLGGVVGMVVAAEDEREEAKAAFMIPSTVLGQAWKGLAYVTLLDILTPHTASIIDNLAVAYSKACPEGWPRAFPVTLPEKISELDDMQPDQKGYSPALKFVAALVSDCRTFPQLSQDLQKWAEKQNSEFSNILEQAREVERANKKSKNSYLMMVVERSRATNGDCYTVKAWIIPDGQVYKRQSVTGAIPLKIPGGIAEAENTFTCAELQSLLSAFLDESGKQRPLKNLTIELFLPAELLHEPVDHWVMDGSYLDEPIGAQYHLVIRSSERLHPRYCSRYGDLWENKWEEMPRPGETLAIDRLILGDNANLNELSQQLKKPKIMGLKLFQEPLRVGEKSTFAALLAAAAPVAIWLRQPLPDIDQSTTIDDLLECCPHGLSEVVKEQRGQAFSSKDSREPDSHIGEHLALLWEDFDRLPPDLDFFMA
jgi:vWA-MoxR associated protein C-terminal domain/Trypsin-like peptidase domain/vWA-MoxR associated protein middle region (VMAP-M) 1